MAATTPRKNPGRGKRLKQLREERPEVSQKAVANAAGVSASRVREWENGAGMYPDSLEKVAAFYGVEVAWLETETEPKARPTNGLLDGLRHLEDEVKEQGREMAKIRNELAEDPRWGMVEEHLNALTDSLRRFLIQAQDEDEGVGLPPPLRPIDLNPEEREP